MKVKRHEETICCIRLKRAMKKGKKILGFLIPVLIVIAGICAVYFFTFSDAYLKIPAKTDLSGSKYVGNWTELGSDGSSGAALDLAENGRALIKLNGRTESVGTWSETESGVVSVSGSQVVETDASGAVKELFSLPRKTINPGFLVSFFIGAVLVIIVDRVDRSRRAKRNGPSSSPQKNLP